jgi:putative endonuclease
VTTSAAARWFCYLLACADGTLYTGITTALDRRLTAHNAGSASKYTRVRRPVRVVWFERCRDRSGASRREAAIKRLSRAAKLVLMRERPARLPLPRAAARARPRPARRD